MEDVARDASTKDIAGMLDWAIWAIFALYLALILVAARTHRDVLKHAPLLILIVVLTFPALPASMNSLKLLRVLQLFALLRLNQRLMWRIFTPSGIRFAAIMTVLVALGGGVALKLAEDYESTWTGVWLSIQTMATVGYGDVVPHTVAGQLIAVFIMVVGIGFMTLIVGAMARKFISYRTDTGLPMMSQHPVLDVAEKLEEYPSACNGWRKPLGRGRQRDRKTSNEPSLVVVVKRLVQALTEGEVPRALTTECDRLTLGFGRVGEGRCASR